MVLSERKMPMDLLYYRALKKLAMLTEKKEAGHLMREVIWENISMIRYLKKLDIITYICSRLMSKSYIQKKLSLYCKINGQRHAAHSIFNSACTIINHRYLVFML